MSASITALFYLLSAALFILSIRGLSSPVSARRGLWCGMMGMAIAIAAAVGGVSLLVLAPAAIAFALGGGVGMLLATRAPMTAMPQLVATFNGLGGLASFLIALAVSTAPSSFGIVGKTGVQSYIEIALSVLIGAVTFSGSVIAAAKLHGVIPPKPIILPLRTVVNLLVGLAGLAALAVYAASGAPVALHILAVLALIAGVVLVIPIGGADMPVVISILNSYSGWAAAALGFTLSNFALIVVGAIVGASGGILSYIMCRAMNRSFLTVLSGGVGGVAETAGSANPDRSVRMGSAEDAAFILGNAGRVIIVPGYGMAVAQAQHAVKDLADALVARGAEVSYAIHPVAGRMPGHMNVLLAEANVPYDDVYAMEDINPSFRTADVALVVGANDVTNPAALDSPSSPIYGMPVLEVWKAPLVMFVKRSLGVGYSGIDNELFYNENTMMLLGEGRKMIEGVVRAMPS